MGKTLLLATLIALLAGCSAAPIPPTYSEQELAAGTRPGGCAPAASGGWLLTLGVVLVLAVAVSRLRFALAVVVAVGLAAIALRHRRHRQ